MMNKQNNNDSHIIDSYYNESPEDKEIITAAEEDFKVKLEKSLERMDSIENLDFPMDINVLGIISKGEIIKDRKKLHLESLAFVALCIIIISAITFLVFKVNIKFVIYAEIILSALLPLTLIPIALNARVKGEA